MADVSVIIPVFNTEKYLDRCLDSVLGQSLENLEVICVDDASADGSAAVLAARAAADSRLRIITLTENGGPGNARNLGIDAASGRYISFLDSDDWLDTDFLSDMLEQAGKTGREVIINSSFVKEYDRQDKKEYGTRFGFLEDGPRAYPTAAVQLRFPPVLWARLYRKDYLAANDIRFPDLRGGGEDNYFTTLAEAPLKDIFIFRGPYYHYWQREDSLAHLRSAGYDFIKAFKALYDELRARSLPTEDLRLFYAGPLDIDSETKFNYIKSFLDEIRPQVLSHAERYIALDLHLLEAVTSSADYADFRSRHSANISIDFIRNRMKQEPLISVIIPVRNGANYLQEALESISRQGCRTEIIVVDDGSEDDTAQIAARFGCKVLSHPESKGPVAAKNTGLKAAAGQFVLFLDHDDRMRDGALRALCSALQGDASASAVQAMVQDFRSPECDDPSIAIRPEPYYGLFTGAILMRRTVFGTIGMFDESKTAGEIIDWTGRMEQNGLTIKKTDLVSTDRRVHGSNFGRTRREEQFKDFAALLRARLKR